MIVTRLELLKRLARLRSEGKQIVFTNGCFDILHRGHVEYLSAARALGDILVVGLNSDDSVRRLKGPGRPINPVEDRAAILDALRAVDFVTVFDEDTPYQLIEAIKPDVLVKGGDYTVETIVGADLVQAQGDALLLYRYWLAVRRVGFWHGLALAHNKIMAIRNIEHKAGSPWETTLMPQ